MRSILAKRLINFFAIVFAFDTYFCFIGKRRPEFPFADYFSNYIPSAFYPQSHISKTDFWKSLFEMFLSFSNRFLQCLYIFFFKKFSYNSCFLFYVWITIVIHGLTKDLVLILLWISERSIICFRKYSY